MNEARNLLDEAMGLYEDVLGRDSPSGKGQMVLIKDCVETNAGFVLHHLIKRSLSFPAAIVIFVAFAHPFSHYDRILRKMGCNLAMQRDNKRFLFFDMLKLESPGGCRGNTDIGGLLELYGEIHKAVEVTSLTKGIGNITIMIDDVSLMEVVSNGCSSDVLNFLHYCCTLTAQFDCSLVALNHEDIYLDMERPGLILQMEYLADLLIRAEPLATGLATDVHGQLTVVSNRICYGLGTSNSKIRNFHFRIKENSVHYFYPGSLS